MFLNLRIFSTPQFSDSAAAIKKVKQYSQANKMAAVIRRRRRGRQHLVLLRRLRVFRDLNDPLESQEEEEVFQRYRFSPASILLILDGIMDLLQADTARNGPISLLIQVLLFLRFIATGAHFLQEGTSTLNYL